MHPLPDEPAAAFTTAAFADISEDRSPKNWLRVAALFGLGHWGAMISVSLSTHSGQSPRATNAVSPVATSTT
jgi:hypothetical protein